MTALNRHTKLDKSKEHILESFTLFNYKEVMTTHHLLHQPPPESPWGKHLCPNQSWAKKKRKVRSNTLHSGQSLSFYWICM